MAYLHEMRLNDAIKRLYLLGKSSRKKDKTSMDGDGAMATAGSAMRDYGDRAKARLKASAGNGFRAEMRSAAGTVTPSEIGSAVSSAGDAGLDKIAASYRPSAARGGIEEELQQFDNDVAYIKQPSIPYQPSPTADAEQALHFQAINKDIEEMPIGGRYTPSGLASASKDAELNAMDRMRLKGLMGAGMGLSQPPMYQPDWAVERRP